LLHDVSARNGIPRSMNLSQKVHNHSLIHLDVSASNTIRHPGTRLHLVHSESLLGYQSASPNSENMSSAATPDAPRDISLLVGVSIGLSLVAAISACWWSSVGSNTAIATPKLAGKAYRKLVSSGEIGQRKLSRGSLQDTIGDQDDEGVTSDSSGGSLADIRSTGSQHDDEVLAGLVTSGRLSILTAQFISDKISGSDAAHSSDSETETVQTLERFEELSQDSADEGNEELWQDPSANGFVGPSEDKVPQQLSQQIDEFLACEDSVIFS